MDQQQQPTETRARRRSTKTDVPAATALPAPDIAPAPAPSTPAPAPAPDVAVPVAPAPVAPTVALPPPFTCAGQVVSYDSVLGVEMRCDDAMRTWRLAADDGWDLPQALGPNVRGTFEARPLHDTAATLIAFTDVNGVRHTPEAELDCFLTTAASRNRGLPDDCEALQVMRAFRDEVLGRDHPDVRAYEAFAPAVVAAVQARPDAGRI